VSKQHFNQAADEEKGLMQRVATGDEGAFERLYERYSRLLYSTIISIIKHPPEAQDVLQEVFVHIWRQAKNFDAERGNVYSWLITITRNRAIDRFRSKGYRSRQYETSDDEEILGIPDTHLTPLDAVSVSERRELVTLALARIPAEQRDALYLAYFQGYTQAEIADLLQIPLGTIKTRMRQGLIKLTSILQGVEPKT
jgi:RNA polymerase sigma-70 factor, ECF subfamily